MDPMTIMTLLQMLQQNPQAAASLGSAARQITAPGNVDPAAVKASFGDFAEQTLRCYHPTARLQYAGIVQMPWPGGDSYGAEGSMVIRMQFTGYSGALYEMHVAAMFRGQQARTRVLSDNALAPPNRQCALENWVG